MVQPMNVVQLQADPEQMKRWQAIRDAEAPLRDLTAKMYASQAKDNAYSASYKPTKRGQLLHNGPAQSWSSPETQALYSQVQAMKGAGKKAADALGMKTYATHDEAIRAQGNQAWGAGSTTSYQSDGKGGWVTAGGVAAPAWLSDLTSGKLRAGQSATYSGIENASPTAQAMASSGQIGSNPFGGGLGANTMKPRSVQTQMFNRPAYQRNRVTTGQMGEMNRSNQDRFRSEVKPLTTAFNRNFNQAQAQQQFADTAASDQNSNQFFGLTNQYNQQQNAMNQQMLMPMLSQLFGGF